MPRPLTKTYDPGKPCRNGHMSFRYEKSKLCVECSKINSIKYAKQNLEKIRERAIRWNKENKDSRKDILKTYSDGNPHVQRAINAKRRASKRSATPSWLTQEQLSDILNLYAIAEECTTYSGQDYHVDHIIPLTSEVICGLHVPWNLQVLPAKLNLQKSNRIYL